jgi:hypothetical protein
VRECEILPSAIFMTFLSLTTDGRHLKQFNQNVLGYLKEKRVINKTRGLLSIIYPDF